MVFVQVESARKLRWYDHEDINRLVESSTKDKKALQTTIAALRQVNSQCHHRHTCRLQPER